MDPADNTFPIPPTDNSGGSTPPPVPASQPIVQADPFAVAPMAQVPDPLTGVPMPPANPSATTPGMPPATQPTPLQPAPQPAWQAQAAADAAALPVGPDNSSLTQPTPAPIPQQPTTSDNLLSPFSSPAPAPAPQSAYGAPAAAIPEANTLDLSGQPVPLAQVPVGAMQPGVEAYPVAQPAPIIDQQLNPAYGPTQDANALPTDLGSFNSDMTGMAAQSGKRKGGPLKIILIVVAVLALLLIISLAIVFSARNQRKPAIELSDQAVQSQTTATTALPDGYKLVARDCYSFGIIPQTTLDFTRTACNIAAKFGATSQYDVLVTPSTAPPSDLTAFANTLKAGTAVSTSNIQIGGIDAVKTVQTVNGVTQQVIAVLPTGKTYTFNGAPVTAFAITSTYSDDDSKTVSDNIVKTWTWK